VVLLVLDDVEDVVVIDGLELDVDDVELVLVVTLGCVAVLLVLDDVEDVVVINGLELDVDDVELVLVLPLGWVVVLLVLDEVEVVVLVLGLVVDVLELEVPLVLVVLVAATVVVVVGGPVSPLAVMRRARIEPATKRPSSRASSSRRSSANGAHRSALTLVRRPNLTAAPVVCSTTSAAPSSDPGTTRDPLDNRRSP
jgi:hypothetical protein